MGTETNKDERSTPEYLAQLLKDKKQIQAFPNVFVHLEKLLDEEINRVRLQLFHHKGNGRIPLDLPEPIGPVQTISEKLYVPVKEHPDFNFVGRILGPRGMTAKELEQFTGCKIMVRGKGSMRDKKKEEQNRGKPNWEHLNEELHVLITVEDTVNRAEVKMAKAMEEVKKLLVPAPEGEDDLKKMQLMELAILNGTYRDSKAIPLAHAFGLPWNAQLQTMQMLGQFDTSGLDHKSILKTSENSCLGRLNGGARFPQTSQMFTSGAFSDIGYGDYQFSEAPRFLTAASPLTAGISQLRSPTPAGAPLILAPRMPQVATSSATMINPPPLVSPTDSAATGLMYNPYEYPYSLQPAATLVEYPTSIEQTAAGAVPKMRRTLDTVRTHPYTRVALP
ncbi:protein quaking-B-like isoform X2 [Crassostrea angulata]|uniref:K Homology domain-containing protein n=1 Tax=Magallana gigas TaxID=29159 RepID=A0A8W8JMP8_MAGGI|nr:protein quaking-B isoform X3 [Crassostrea gigas]XP_052709940.1 protein quaking-B-like isoform X2 [Crassostrea angulata]|eukprot:XP_011435249.1 PREDICTED: protein quaking-B isoform X2 [Crassostrea gigas]